jgi:hypothetical protein
MSSPCDGGSLFNGSPVTVTFRGTRRLMRLLRRRQWPPPNENGPKIGISPAIGKFFIKSWAKSVHEERWKSETEYRQAREFLVKLPTELSSRWLISRNRKDVRWLAGILSGHCGLRRHLNLMRLVETEDCPHCGESETAFHFLCECPRYLQLREEVLGAYQIELQNVPALSWNSILTFIRRSNRFDI